MLSDYISYANTAPIHTGGESFVNNLEMDLENPHHTAMGDCGESAADKPAMQPLVHD